MIVSTCTKETVLHLKSILNLTVPVKNTWIRQVLAGYAHWTCLAADYVPMQLFAYSVPICTTLTRPMYAVNVRQL